MTKYSVQLRDPILVNSNRFLFFSKNMDKNIGKNISKNLRGKYSQELLDHAKQPATNALSNVSRKIHLYPEQRKNIIDDLRLK